MTTKTTYQCISRGCIHYGCRKASRGVKAAAGECWRGQARVVSSNSGCLPCLPACLSISQLSIMRRPHAETFNSALVNAGRQSWLSARPNGPVLSVLFVVVTSGGCWCFKEGKLIFGLDTQFVLLFVSISRSIVCHCPAYSMNKQRNSQLWK